MNSPTSNDGQGGGRDVSHPAQDVPTETPPFLAARQRLGFLPTAAFWVDGEDYPPLRWRVRAAKVAALVGLLLILRRAPLDLALAGRLIAFGAGAFVVLGLFERVLRWSVKPASGMRVA